MKHVMLDLAGLKCPLPALRTRKALLTMTSGERLEVHCTDPMAVIDIPNLVRQTGDLLELAAQADGRYTFLILKGGAST
jgi:tRNA 2-thiouridine synthesizing protein A